MKKFISLLVMVVMGMMMGCHQPTAKSTTPKVVKRKTPKKEAPPCKALHKKVGKHCIVIIAKCRARPNGPRSTIVSVAVTNTANEGKLAAEESLDIMVDYFKGLPNLQVLTLSNVKGVPLYIFVVLGVKPLLPSKHHRRLKHLQHGNTKSHKYYPKYKQKLHRH